jgi:vanillate O-demethylase ferredoxin subunit
MNEVWRDVAVIARRAETADIVVLDLAASDGRELPSFEAGAHIDVEIRPDLRRQYSLCALPASPCVYRIGVLRDPHSRGGSAAMHALDVGARLRISEPRNHFPLCRDAAGTLLFAGGIGVTPLLCMADELQRRGAAFSLHYCARSAGHAAFLADLRAADYAERVALHFDDHAEQRLDIDAVLADARPAAHLYVCGPGGFMAWIEAAAERAGWPAAQVHREYFSAEPPAAQAGDQPFRVRLAQSGRVLDVPADRSIVAVLRDHGIALPVSCEAGVCGTCLTGLLAGEAEHRDYYLTDEEKARGDQILPCCSRARSSLLVLDL